MQSNNSKNFNNEEFSSFCKKYTTTQAYTINIMKVFFAYCVNQHDN